jgi:hypothetical protein
VEGTIEQRHAVRRAVLPLISERGFQNVSFADAAGASGLTEAELSALFGRTREIVTANDYFEVIVTAFRESSSELSCTAAWVIAIDEIAATMSAKEWATERLRNEVYAREDEVIGGIVKELWVNITGLNHAVAERCGVPVDSTPVAVFTGTVIGTMLSMPIGYSTDSYAWVEAHAVAIEALGPSLDQMLRRA